MLYTSRLRNKILLDPVALGADSLKIISGYATDTMASWHLTEITSKYKVPLKITLVVGMCRTEGLSIAVHRGFQNLVLDRNLPYHSRLSCQYVYEGSPVHSKLYLWEKQGKPVQAFVGSANYTQTAFSAVQCEAMTDCDPAQASDYFQSIEANSIYCTHAEVEEYITMHSASTVFNEEQSPIVSLRGSDLRHVTLSLLSKDGDIGRQSGLNWGQRTGREPNQAYIPVPSSVARSHFFPASKQHFSVLTDDGRHLILRIEQQNDKAITTPLNNSSLGEYFRNRLCLPNGAFVYKQDLINYGRTDVTFYKLDEEQFFMDFSVQDRG